MLVSYSFPENLGGEGVLDTEDKYLLDILRNIVGKTHIKYLLDATNQRINNYSLLFIDAVKCENLDMIFEQEKISLKLVSSLSGG